MTSQNNYWVLRQNYGSKTNQDEMKGLILKQQIVTCPWGGWGIAKQNVIDKKYNENHIDRPGGRPSKGQDRRFVEEMRVGDIIIIPFPKKNGCVVARIASDVEYSVDTGLFWTETSEDIRIGDTGDAPFQPISRRIEILHDNFLPSCVINNRMSVSKMGQAVMDNVNKIIQNKN